MRAIHLKRLVIVIALALALQGCVTRAEYAETVKAWRTYYDATAFDLRAQYDVLPEPSRGTRLRMIIDEDPAIRAAEVRAGLRAETAPEHS